MMSAEDEGEARAAARRPPARRRAAPVIEGEAKLIEGAAPTGEVPPAEAAPAERVPADKVEEAQASPAAVTGNSSPRRILLFTILGGALAGAFTAALALFLLLPARVAPPSGSAGEELAQRLKGVEQRLAALENQSAAAPAATDMTRLSQDISALKQALAGLQTRLAAAPQSSSGSVSGRDDIAALRQGLAVLEQKIAALPDQGRIEGDVATLRRELAARPATGGEPAALLLVAVELLRSTFERGEPFASEIEVARGLGLEAAIADRLAAKAEKGVPTARQLGERFSERAAAMLDSLQARPETTSDHVLQMLGRVVRIRPAGDVPGSDPGAVIARIEARLKRNDGAGALSEAAALPAPARQVAEPLLAELLERVELERMMSRLVSELVKALPRKG